MKRCALLTCEDLENHILDEDRLEKALTESGWEFQWIPWRQSGVEWDSFDCAIVRTTWDYTADPVFFLQQLKKIEDSQCQLHNPYSVIEWNSQKTYLKFLAEKGVPVIPTVWGSWQDLATLRTAAESLQSPILVVKPQVGAGAKNTFKLQANDSETWEQVFANLKGQDLMIQPFMEKVATEGEHSAHFFAGEFSHLVLKTPKDNDFRSQEEFGSHVRKIEISASHSQFCQQVLAQISEPYLYARVDYINDDDGNPQLIELELIEPSLYFRYDDKAAIKMVAALENLMKN